MFRSEGLGLGFLLSLFSLDLLLSHIVIEVCIHRDGYRASSFVLAFLYVLILTLKFIVIVRLLLIFISLNRSVDVFN